MHKMIEWIIVINNRDLNFDQNNRDYDFGHNRAALIRLMHYSWGKIYSPEDKNAEAISKEQFSL